MSVRLLHLNKLLRLSGFPENKLRSAIRDDLRAERKKLQGDSSGGGDFHQPFWSDAKAHVIGALDLLSQTESRIKDNWRRKRLYALLANGFLDWFDQLKRGTNQRISWMPESVHNHYEVPGLGLTVKVDNLLGLRIGTNHRLIYPYFNEEPILSEQWARIRQRLRYPL